MANVMSLAILLLLPYPIGGVATVCLWVLVRKLYPEKAARLAHVAHLASERVLDRLEDSVKSPGA